MRIALIVKPGSQQTGIGRYTDELTRALSDLGQEVILVHPTVPLPGWLVGWVRRRLGWDLQTFFSTYPIWVRYPKDVDLYHLSSQNLATLMFFCPPPGMTVITVQDIIPYMFHNNPEINVYLSLMNRIFDWIAMQGIKKANFLLAISDQSGMDTKQYLGIPSEKIRTVYLAA